MLFVGGVRCAYRRSRLAALPLVAYGVLREGYRLRRILAFVDPDRDSLGINFQLKQSFIAFGSGGLWGVGLGGSRQKMFLFLSAYRLHLLGVGEELGLAGPSSSSAFWQWSRRAASGSRCATPIASAASSPSA